MADYADRYRDASVHRIIGTGGNVTGNGGAALQANIEPEFISRDNPSSGMITALIGPPKVKSATTVAGGSHGNVFISQYGKGAKHREILTFNPANGSSSALNLSSFAGKKVRQLREVNRANRS